MGRIKDKLFDLTPCWLFRLWIWLKERPRQIRWWFQRANGHVPSCDCWEFNDTIAHMLDEGLTWMLEHGVSKTWRNDKSAELQREELLFIRDTMREFLEYHGGGVEARERGLEMWEEHQAHLEKAFKLLAEYFWGLWD